MRATRRYLTFSNGKKGKASNIGMDEFRCEGCTNVQEHERERQRARSRDAREWETKITLSNISSNTPGIFLCR
jgi:hypothetical protein